MSSIQAVFFDIGDTLVSERQWTVGAREVIKAFRTAEVRLGLISNTGSLNREALAELLPDDFDFGLFQEDLVFLSSEVGVEKPDLSIFMMAVSHAHCSPWETLFVGESLEETFAAQRAGMQAIRLSNPADDFPLLRRLILGF